jgi:hypothetical protein
VYFFALSAPFVPDTLDECAEARLLTNLGKDFVVHRASYAGSLTGRIAIWCLSCALAEWRDGSSDATSGAATHACFLGRLDGREYGAIRCGNVPEAGGQAGPAVDS